jgi:penicillin amidase
MASSGKGSRPQDRSGSRSGKSNGRSVSPSASADMSVRNDAVTIDDVRTAQPSRRRVFSRRNVLIGALVAVLLIVGVLGGIAWWTVNKTLPTLNGTAQLPGLTANVTVTRDTYGVPHIEAVNLHDLYMAQGYVHAQDRLYQMFYFRTVGEGRLAELFNPDEQLISADRYLRTVGFRRAGEAEWQAISPEARSALEAYAAGVNAFVHSHADNLPIEFTFLGVGFEDWQPVDTITFGKLEARDLSETWSQELLASDILQKVGPDVTAKVMPGYPASAPVILPGANSGSFSPAIEGYNKYVRPLISGWGEDVGSNNWVVDGTKSTTGKPILANDPHLGVRNPSIWYQVHLSTTDGKYDAAGFGFAGVPGIVTGHNKDIAWGVTNTEADVEDVFQEKLDEANHPGQYLSGDKWVPLTIYTETIKVKGGAPTVTQTVRYTNHGPLLSDWTATLTPTVSTSVTGTFSVEWTALKPGHLLDAVNGLQTASNWTEFRAALSKWDVPGQNFVYADTKGNIGYQMTGLLPVRKKGDGSVPGIGWTGENDWTGFVPFDDMPRMYNPPDHYVATANNKNVGPDFKYGVSGYWAAPYRILRITEMLKAKEKVSVEDMRAMQFDTQSMLARKVAPIMASANITDTRARQAADLLKNWDGTMKADSTAAAIYEVSYHKLLTNTLGDELGTPLIFQYLDGMGGQALQTIEGLLDKPDDPLWDRTDTPQVEKRDDILVRSITEATGELTAALGDNMQDWTWGKIHEITPRHEFSSADLVGGLFSLAASPIGGDNTTVAVASYPLPYAGVPLQGPFPVTNYQSYRMIIDVGDWTKSLAVFATGESGQPGSKYWGNMYSQWLQGAYNPLVYTKEQIDANKDAVLTLTP